MNLNTISNTCTQFAFIQCHIVQTGNIDILAEIEQAAFENREDLGKLIIDTHERYGHSTFLTQLHEKKGEKAETFLHRIFHKAPIQGIATCIKTLKSFLEEKEIQDLLALKAYPNENTPLHYALWGTCSLSYKDLFKQCLGDICDIKFLLGLKNFSLTTPLHLIKNIFFMDDNSGFLNTLKDLFGNVQTAHLMSLEQDFNFKTLIYGTTLHDRPKLIHTISKIYNDPGRFSEDSIQFIFFNSIQEMAIQRIGFFSPKDIFDFIAYLMDKIESKTSTENSEYRLHLLIAAGSGISYLPLNTFVRLVKERTLECQHITFKFITKTVYIWPMLLQRISIGRQHMVALIQSRVDENALYYFSQAYKKGVDNDMQQLIKDSYGSEHERITSKLRRNW